MRFRKHLVLLLGYWIATTGLYSAELHVATTGNDANPGTQSEPFATLERARDAIRMLKKADTKFQDAVNVIVHGGAYELTQPLELTAEDSGTPEAPIVYQAARGEEVRIVGGRTVDIWKLELRATWPVHHEITPAAVRK